VALGEGQPAEAAARLEESLALSRSVDNKLVVALALRALGLLATRTGNLAAAEAQLEESRSLAQELGDGRTHAETLEALAELRAAQGRPAEAAELLGSAAAARERLGTPLPPCDQPRRAALVASLRNQLRGVTG
jgi:ATP/maltotriose-dependent transcriptional regulator MalT